MAESAFVALSSAPVAYSQATLDNGQYLVHPQRLNRRRVSEDAPFPARASGVGVDNQSTSESRSLGRAGILIAAVAGLVRRRRRTGRDSLRSAGHPRSRTLRLEQLSDSDAVPIQPDQASTEAPTKLPGDELFTEAESDLAKLGYGIRVYRFHHSMLPSGVDKFIETGGGAALLAGAGFLSLLLANIPWTRSWWLSLWATKIGLVVSVPGAAQATQSMLSVKGWVNEGLMAIFFFVVGLEIKKEATVGCLTTLKSAALPCIAAFGGMIVPIAVYVAVNLLLPGGNLGGWSTPMATDIAFALGVLTLFSKRMPKNASAFLLALATVDDIGAIAVLALSGLGALRMKYVGLCAAICGLLWQMHTHTDYETKYFMMVGVGLWVSLIGAGLSAEVAGCITAAAIPTKPDPDDLPLMQTVSPDSPNTTPTDAQKKLWSTSRIDKLVKGFAPLVSLVILPVFAFANLAVPLSGGAAGAGTLFARPTPALGLALGLLIGKPLGIFGASWLAVKAGIGRLPKDVGLNHLAALSVLGGIGFTMCLFLVDRAIDPAAQTLARLAVVGSSVVMAAISALLMGSFKPHGLKEGAQSELKTPGDVPLVENEG